MSDKARMDWMEEVSATFFGVGNPTGDKVVFRWDTDGDTEHSFFVGVFNSKAETITFESAGKGFGGDIGVMIGVNLADDTILGLGVTTHQETPGVGSLAKTDPAFAAQFKGMPFKDQFAVKPDGGQVDALSGATVTSRGVAAAVSDAVKVYEKLKPQIAEKAKSFSK